jgi:hypothetical protein
MQMAVEEAKLQHLLLRDPLQEVVEVKCLHREVRVVQVHLLLQEVMLVEETLHAEVVQEDS